jgi:hypothetical protein
LKKKQGTPEAQADGSYEKLCAKNASSFSQFPQPLLLEQYVKENKAKTKTLFLFARLDIHIAVR